jgi:hypothetical protein
MMPQLLIYRIDGQSKARESKPDKDGQARPVIREDLGLNHDAIGVSIWVPDPLFDEATGRSRRSYKSVLTVYIPDVAKDVYLGLEDTLHSQALESDPYA